MFLFKKVKSFQSYAASLRQQSATIGFIPTMGALHTGHLALLQQAAQEGNRTVCSIFVNPTQFNDPNDLAKYPRMPEKDIEMLESVGCDVLFMPSVAEIYPPNQQNRTFEFGHLDKVMEGAFRPGHFQGVAQVVSRLLDIVQPDALYMGQKDYQQVTVVRSMLQQLQLPVRLVMCATLRETDGLAMSSRNARLSSDFRQKAPAIYQTLLQCQKLFLSGHSTAEIQQQALETLTNAGLQPEYVDLVDGETLLPVERFNDSNNVVACTAVWAGEVRLIDNIQLKG